MFKQLTSILTISIISLMVLAHAVVPHHHHGNIPHFTVFTSHHHDVTDDDADDCCCSHPNTPDHTGDEGSCPLEQFVLISPSDTKEDGCTAICIHDHSVLQLQAVLFTIYYDLSSPEKEIRFRQPPYLINYHSVFASHSLGLRAPPMV